MRTLFGWRQYRRVPKLFIAGMQWDHFKWLGPLILLLLLRLLCIAVQLLLCAMMLGEILKMRRLDRGGWIHTWEEVGRLWEKAHRLLIFCPIPDEVPTVPTYLVYCLVWKKRLILATYLDTTKVVYLFQNPHLKLSHVSQPFINYLD